MCPECRVIFEDDARACPEHGAELVSPDVFPKARALESGTMVGEYRLDRLLGSGSFGDVYAGEHPLIGKKVAVKVLNPRVASDPETVSRFIAEARAVNKIRHRNIIDIFSFNVLPGVGHYFVMELLDGSTLAALLEKRGPLPIALTLEIARGIAAALDAAHEAGITHRDLKPENVFLAAERDGSYFPKLLDFGIAKLIDDEVAHKTGSGVVLGTPLYMAPEQARGKRVDHRADIYALGVMIHEMLTGAAPFLGDSAMAILLQHDNEPPPPMSSKRADLPPELDAPVLAMLAKRPKDRPRSAGEAVAALVACAAEPTSVSASSGASAPRVEQSTEKLSALDSSNGMRRKVPSARWGIVALGMLVLAGLASLGLRTRATENAAPGPEATTSTKEPEIAPTPSLSPPQPEPMVSVAPSPPPSASVLAPTTKGKNGRENPSANKKTPGKLDRILGERE